MKKILNKFFKYILFLLLFIITLIIGFNIFINKKDFTILDAFNSINKIDKANINIDFINKNNDSDEKIINYSYHANYNKSFTDDTYKNVSILSGTLEIENQTDELTFYLPLQLIKQNNNIDAFLKIEDDDNILNLPTDTLYLNLNSFLENKNYNVDDLNNLKNNLYKILKTYLKHNKSKYKFIKTNDKKIFKTGYFVYNLTQEDFNELKKLITTNLSKDLINKFNINTVISENEKFLKSSVISIAIYNNYITAINIENDIYQLKIDISNINNNLKIESFKKENSINIINKELSNKNIEENKTNN